MEAELPQALPACMHEERGRCEPWNAVSAEKERHPGALYTQGTAG